MSNAVSPYSRLGHQGMRHKYLRLKAPWLVILTLCCSRCALAQSPNGQTTSAAETSASQPYIPLDSNGNPLPYRPKDGDKLGYSKEESIRRLDPEVREFLDGILRLYKEPGLFANRRQVFAAIGAQPGFKEVLPHSIPRVSATDKFRQYPVLHGLFVRPAWSATYQYSGREERGGRSVWMASLAVIVAHEMECVSSRAVEGYLNLYLYNGLDGTTHPPPPSQWDRHGLSGRPSARPLSTITPAINLGFIDGCFVHVFIGNSFDQREINDDNVLN